MSSIIGGIYRRPTQHNVEAGSVSVLPSIQEPVLPNEVRQLSSRRHAQLKKNVGEMCADRSRRDLERSADLLVRFSPRYHASDLDLAARQAGSSARDRLRRWSYAALTHFLAGAAKLFSRSESRQYVVSLTQLASPLFVLAHFPQGARDPPPYPSRFPWNPDRP